MISMMPTQALIPPGPSPVSGAEAFFALLHLVSDVDASKERLKKIFDACVEANDKIREANELQPKMTAARKEHDETLLRERTEHDRTIAAARAKFDSECNAGTQKINEMRANAERLQVKAQADAAAASELRADLQRRLDTIKKAAA
jgi:hypothetical protein